MYILALALPVLLHRQYFGPFNVCVSPLMRPMGPLARTSKQKIREQVSQFYLGNFAAMCSLHGRDRHLILRFWLFWLTFLLRQLQRVGNSKAKHWRWTTRGMSRNLCLFETPLQILYIHTFTEDLEGFPVSKKKKLRPLYRWPFAWRIQISHFLKHLIPPLLHVLLHRQ